MPPRARITPDLDPTASDPVEAPAVTAPASPADPPPAPGRYAFAGPYPVVVAELGREVHEGDVLDWPAGPPNTAQWQPTEAPATPAREG